MKYWYVFVVFVVLLNCLIYFAIELLQINFCTKDPGLLSVVALPLPRLAEQSAKRAIPNRVVKHFSVHDTRVSPGDNRSRPGSLAQILTIQSYSNIIIL